MLNHYLACFRFASVKSANVMIEILRKLPIIGGRIKDSYTNDEKKKFMIMSQIFRFLFEILKIFMYVLFFMYIPMKIFSKSMEAGSAAFSVENSFVYFSLVLSCFVGSIIHSKLFDVNEWSYVSLKIMRANPAIYFRIQLMRRGITEIVGFMLSFVIFGMNLGYAFFLVIIIVISRYFGEVLNVMIFRVTGKSFNDIKSASVLMMLAGLFLAYFVTYLRGCVPSAYNFVFKTMWFHMILLLGVIFIYFLWSSENFDSIISRIYVHQNIITEEIEVVEESWVSDDRVEGKKVKKSKNSGSRFLIEMFFKRNRKMLIHENMVKLISIAAVFVLGLGAHYTGNDDAVKKVILYSMPILIFVVFSLCDTSRYCRELFKQCDKFIIRFDNDNEKTTDNFLFALCNLLKVNIAPVAALSVAYLLIGMVSSSAKIKDIIFICLGIFLLGILFTCFSLLAYYLIQPYDGKGNIIKKRYYIIYLIVYVICYASIFIKSDNQSVLLVIGLITSIVVAGSLTLVYRFGKRTFRIRK